MKKIIKCVFSATFLSLVIAISSFASERGWVATNDTWSYINNDGSEATDTWKQSGNSWYYLNSNGVLAIDQVVEYNNKYYYVDEHGAMIKDCWVAVPADESEEQDVSYRWMYFGHDGSAYKENGSGVTLKTINNKKYAFDSDGKMLFGFVDDSGTIKNTDEEPIIGSTYYFGSNDDGSLHTGWLEYTAGIDAYDDKSVLWFYYNSNGKLAKDTTKNINGKKYSFDSEGVMISEWVVGTETKYYSTEDDGSLTKKNWIYAVPSEDINAEDHDNDEYRWFYVNGSGETVKNQTKKVNGKWYAFDKDGIMQTEFVVLDSDRVSTGNYVSSFDADDVTADDIYKLFDNNVNTFFYFSDTDTDGSMKTGKSVKIDLSDDSYTFAFKKTSGTPYNGLDSSKLYRCGILQTAGDDKFKVKKYFDGTDYKYFVVNTSGSILKAGHTGKSSNDEYFAVYNNIGDIDTIKCFSGDDASKVANQYAKYGNTDIDSKYEWAEVSFDY